MKKIRIKHIFLQNFGKFFGANTVDADISDRTEICGVNECGKTTIKRAVQYVLNCRDDNGKEMKGDPQIGIPPTFKRIKNNANDPEKIYYMPNGANLSSQLISLGAKFRIPQYNFLLLE